MIGFKSNKDKQSFDLKRTLTKQLKLLSERSEVPGSDIPALTHAMCEPTSAMCELIKTADDYCSNC